MTCRELEAHLIELVDRRLDSATELRLNAHLETCGACRRRVEIWETLVPRMRALEPAAPSPMNLRRLESAIERQLATAPRPLPRPWRRTLVFAAALAAAVAFTVTWSLTSRRSQRQASPVWAVLAGVSGEVRGNGQPVGTGAHLAAGTRLDVSAGAESILELGKNTSVRLQGPAATKLDGSTEHILLMLPHGVLRARVAHREPGQTFVVSLPHGRVEVRGTRFVAGATEEGEWVEVEEGQVAAIAGDGTEHLVRAGRMFRFTTIAPQPASEPVSANGMQDAQLSQRTPRSAIDCEAERVRCDNLARQTRQATRARHFERALRGLDRFVPGKECIATDESCLVELGYLRAEALHMAGKTDAAVAAYKALDRRTASPTMRHNALYAAAQIERDMGRSNAALEDYEKALATFPTGPLREEAMLGAMEVAARLDRKRAISAARRYLTAYPKGTGATTAKRILETVTP